MSKITFLRMNFQNGRVRKEEKIVWNIREIDLKKRLYHGPILEIGRDPKITLGGEKKIQIPMKKVSSAHGYFEINPASGKIYYHDTSSNGTRILDWHDLNSINFQTHILTRDKYVEVEMFSWLVFLEGGLNGYILKILEVNF